jgi:hypothetical protein
VERIGTSKGEGLRRDWRPGGGEVGSEWERGGRKEGGRRPPVKDPTTARVGGRAKMSKDGFLLEPGEYHYF